MVRFRNAYVRDSKAVNRTSHRGVLWRLASAGICDDSERTQAIPAPPAMAVPFASHGSIAANRSAAVYSLAQSAEGKPSCSTRRPLPRRGACSHCYQRRMVHQYQYRHFATDYNPGMMVRDYRGRYFSYCHQDDQRSGRLLGVQRLAASTLLSRCTNGIGGSHRLSHHTERLDVLALGHPALPLGAHVYGSRDRRETFARRVAWTTADCRDLHSLRRILTPSATVAATAGMPRGDYQIDFSGSRYINALEVR